MKLDNNPAEKLETILARVVTEWADKKPQLVIGMERYNRENGNFLLIKIEEKRNIIKLLKDGLKKKEFHVEQQMSSLVKRGVLSPEQASYAQKR
jgi:hypothetical protein